MKQLPIGSIVLLKSAKKLLMIVGYLPKDINNETKDYMGIPYPEGIISEESIRSFNKEDIEEVKYEGYQNFLFDKFIKKLNLTIESSDNL